MTRGRVTRNFALLSLGELATRLLAFVVTIHISRALGARDFGIIVFVTSVLAYGTACVDLGLPIWGQRESARDATPLSHVAALVTTVRLLAVCPVLLGMLLFGALAGVADGAQRVLLIYGISLVTEAVALDWLFLGAGNVKPVTWSVLLGQASFAILVVSFTRAPTDILLVPTFYLVGQCVTVAIQYYYCPRRFHLKLRGEWSHIKSTLAAALPFTGTHLVSTTYAHFDVIFVSLALGTVSSGHYGVSYRLLWLTLLLAQSYFTAIGPVIARSYVTGLSAIRDFLEQSVRISVAFMIGVVVGGVLLAKPLILYLFGLEYLPSVLPFQILLVGGFGGMVLTNHQRLLLDSYNYQKVNFLVFLGGTLLNVGANLWLVPRAGIVGAAWALLVSRFAMFAASYVCAWRFVRRVRVEQSLFKPLIAALAMAGVLSVIASWHVALQVVVGGVVYLLGLLALGIVSLSQVLELVADLHLRPASSADSL